MVIGEEITNYMQILYQKQGNVENIEIPPLIINRRLSLVSPELLDFCFAMERNILYSKSYYYFKTMNSVIPKRAYIPTTKEMKSMLEQSKENKSKKENFYFLYEKIVNHYKWGKKEEELYKSHYYKLFEDKKMLIYFYRFFDVPENQWKNV